MGAVQRGLRCGPLPSGIVGVLMTVCWGYSNGRNSYNGASKAASDYTACCVPRPPQGAPRQNEPGAGRHSFATRYGRARVPRRCVAEKQPDELERSYSFHKRCLPFGAIMLEFLAGF